MMYKTQQSAKPCYYESHYPLFALDWNEEDYVALGSYKEDSFNKLQVIHSEDLVTWDKLFECNVTYPVTRCQWLPKGGRKLATCSDSLRIWSVGDSLQEQLNLSLCKYSKQSSGSTASAALGSLPPVTSFDWNSVDTNLIISSSIDTTCTVWDLQSSNYVKTQLIAHDSEVYDVKFLTNSTQLFASCGGDGSVRVFDLRCLAHSTIIYEPLAGLTSGTVKSSGEGNVGGNEDGTNHTALLRLEPSPFDPNVVATLTQDSNAVLILDMRYPGSPILTLEGHSSAVNQMKWHPTQRNVLLTCGDDCQVLYWDINSWLHHSGAATSKWNTNNVVHSLETPKFAYNDAAEINNIAWRPQGDWFGMNTGKQFMSVRC